jgi:hypothetical protein
MKRIKLFLGIIGLFIMMTSCSNDSDGGQNQMRVFAKGTYIDSANKLGGDGSFPSNVIILNSFRINVEEVTLKYLDPGDDDDGGGETGRNDGDHEYKNITVVGPWELDLLNQTISIATVNVPNGVYKAAKLELGKSLVPTSPIFNKTVEITGTRDGIPFIFWHDFDQRLNLNHHDLNGSLVINNNSLDMLFNFDLNDLLDLIDISSAEDRDGDGVIEIGPNDDDGNSELAHLLNTHLGDCGGIEDNNHH